MSNTVIGLSQQSPGNKRNRPFDFSNRQHNVFLSVITSHAWHYLINVSRRGLWPIYNVRIIVRVKDMHAATDNHWSWLICPRNHLSVYENMKDNNCDTCCNKIQLSSLKIKIQTTLKKFKKKKKQQKLDLCATWWSDRKVVYTFYGVSNHVCFCFFPLKSSVTTYAVTGILSSIWKMQLHPISLLNLNLVCVYYSIYHGKTWAISQQFKVITIMKVRPSQEGANGRLM